MLVLNATYEPINVCTVRRAVVLLLKEKAEVIEHSQWELHSATRTLARPVVISGATTLFVAYVVFTGMLFLVPQWLQDVQGQSVVTVGLLLVPFAGVFGLASMWAAPLVARIGARATVTGGLVLCAAGIAALAALQDTTIVLSIAAMALVGLGLAGLIAPASTVVMNDLPAAKAGDGSSINMVSRFVGGAVGVAVAGSVLASVYRDRVGHAVTGLSSAKAADAKSSLQGGLEVAAGLPRAVGGPLATAVRAGFDAGARTGYLAIAVLAGVAAGWVWRALRPSAERRR